MLWRDATTLLASVQKLEECSGDRTRCLALGEMSDTIQNDTVIMRFE